MQPGRNCCLYAIWQVILAMLVDYFAAFSAAWAAARRAMGTR